jgi:hypothetical protein
MNNVLMNALLAQTLYALLSSLKILLVDYSMNCPRNGCLLVRLYYEMRDALAQTCSGVSLQLVM